MASDASAFRAMLVQVYMPLVAPSGVSSPASASSPAMIEASSVGNVTMSCFDAMAAILSSAPFVPAGTVAVTVTSRPPLSGTRSSPPTPT